MNEETIQALLMLNTVTINDLKVIIIPYEDILRGKVSICMNEDNSVTTDKDNHPIIDDTVQGSAIKIPAEIRKLYPPEKSDQLAQDVADYLRVVAKSWEFKNLAFKPTILKKAAAYKPVLNGVIFMAYGKDGDKYLTDLVTSNKAYIEECWKEIE